jgi:hypothetical protein
MYEHGCDSGKCLRTLIKADPLVGSPAEEGGEEGEEELG